MEAWKSPVKMGGGTTQNFKTSLIDESFDLRLFGIH